MPKTATKPDASKVLAKFDGKKWEAAKKKYKKSPDAEFRSQKEFYSFDAGTYAMRLSEAKIDTSSKGNFGSFTKFINKSEGDGHGESLLIFRKIDDEDDLAGVIQDYTRLGIDGLDDAKVSDLLKACTVLTKKKPLVRIKVNDSGWGSIVKLLDDEEDADGDDDDSSDADDDSDDGDDDLSLTFEDDDISEKQVKQIKSLAKKSGVKKKGSTLDLLEALAQAAGVTGEFKKAAKLISAIEEAQGGDDDDDSDDDDSDDSDDSNDDDDSSDDDDDSDDSDDNDDADDDDGDGPVIGDVVKFKPEGSKKSVEGKVLKINEKKKTADVKVGNKKYPGIDWADLTVQNDEDDED